MEHDLMAPTTQLAIKEDTSNNWPPIDDIRKTKRNFRSLVLETPVWQWQGDALSELLGKTEVFLKLELFQYTGSFKPRGAIAVIQSLPPAALVRGVAAISAGNHAAGVAYAAKALQTHAKVVIPKTANPARVERCKKLGAEVIFVETLKEGYLLIEQIAKTEDRTIVHQYEGPLTALGNATIGLELCEQVANLDAVLVPVGGGGLCGGIAAAVKQLQPQCRVFGIEPLGANTMWASFASGKPESIETPATIADSLGVLRALPFSFSLCRQYVDEIITIDDDAICQAMELLFREMKLAVEPAGAIATAALLGPLRKRLHGKRVGLVVCGANIDVDSFHCFIGRGLAQ